MIIEVLPEDINKANDVLNGQPGMTRAFNCPVAQAIIRVTGNRRVCIGPTAINIGDDRFPAPDNVREFISAYDGRRGLPNCTFEIHDYPRRV